MLPPVTVKASGRPAGTVAGQMDLAGQAASGPAEPRGAKPSFPAPATCWWARTIMEWTDTSRSMSPAASALAWAARSIRSKVPSLAHRRNRVCNVAQQPCRSGTSRQAVPVRNFRTIPLRTVRSSNRLRPRSNRGGNGGTGQGRNGGRAAAARRQRYDRGPVRTGLRARSAQRMRMPPAHRVHRQATPTPPTPTGRVRTRPPCPPRRSAAPTSGRPDRTRRTAAGPAGPTLVHVVLLLAPHVSSPSSTSDRSAVASAAGREQTDPSPASRRIEHCTASFG